MKYPICRFELTYSNQYSVDAHIFPFCSEEDYIEKGKVRITLLNYCKSLIFNIQLQKRITKVIQLSKSGKFDYWVVFKVVLYFLKSK